MGQSECAVIEITKEDLQRMRGGVVYDKREKFLEEKRKLKALSDERAQRWPNTIEALRIKRLQAQKEELERIELEKMKLDADEAKYRAEKRKKQIERATKLLLLPHMKEAISKHHINTIIKERDAQIRYKEKIKDIMKKQEEKWFDIQKRQQNLWKAEEIMEKNSKKIKIEALLTARSNQLKEHYERSVREKEMKKEEREYLARLAEEDKLLKEKMEDLKRKKLVEMNHEIIEIKRARQASKEEERNMTREMDRKMEEYAAEREKINQEKKKQEAAKGALRGVRFDAMIEKQRQMLREAKEDDEKRYHCAKRGIESEQDARLQTEALKRQKDWEECDISRKKQVELKKRQQENEKEDERLEAKQVEEQVFKIKSELDAFQKDCFAKNRSVAEANKHAVEAKIKKEMQDKEDNIYDAKSAFQRIKNDEYVNIPLEFLKIC